MEDKLNHVSKEKESCVNCYKKFIWLHQTILLSCSWRLESQPSRVERKQHALGNLNLPDCIFHPLVDEFVIRLALFFVEDSRRKVLDT